VPLPDISETHPVAKGIQSYSHRHIPKRIAQFYGISQKSFDPNANVSSF